MSRWWLLVLFLPGCSEVEAVGIDLGYSPGTMHAVVSITCEVGEGTEVFVDTLISGLLPELEPLALIDKALIHPSVTKACSDVGGTAVLATVKSTTLTTEP